MTAVDRELAWSVFTEGFFSPPNEFRAEGDHTVENVVGLARIAWNADASPFFLPVLASGWTYWYAVCPDKEQRKWVVDLIRSHIGSWIDFDGRPVPDDSDLAMDRAVRGLVGMRGCAFRLRVPKNDQAVAQVEQSLGRLVRTLADRPHRRVRLTAPIGRLISDFQDAIAAGAQVRAENLLDTLEEDQRLSLVNRLFLRLQHLAAFEQWERLAELEQLPDLARMNRPTLVSDALARLAIARLPVDAGLDDFVESMTMFGGLVPSVTAIRSEAGARYYAFWCLASGESAQEVVVRLRRSGWLQHVLGMGTLAALLAGGNAPDLLDVAVDRSELHRTVADGRYDAAVDLLGQMSPTEGLLPLLVDLFNRTFSDRAAELFQQWSRVLGDSVVQAVMSARQRDSSQELDLAALPFAEAVVRAMELADAAERSGALDGLRAQSVPRLMQPGAIAGLVETIAQLDSLELVDFVLDLERDLVQAAGDVSGIQELRLRTVEVWALLDESGDRRRAVRLVEMIGRAFDTGVGRAAFDDLVEHVSAAWTHFLTDADLPLGLEVLELLAAHQPDTGLALQDFATSMLSRVGPHSARRIDAAWLHTAAALAAEFGLVITTPELTDDEQQLPDDGSTSVPTGTFVAIYSLMEPAALRAASIIRRRYTGVRVETLVSKVANDSLRLAARNADLLVIADKAASHAATEALKAARGRRPIAYARGGGTTSLIEAVMLGLEAIFR
jgi:hypothetical protein